MVRLTLIARVHDGLPLAEGLDGEKDRDLETYKHQAKVNFNQAPSGPTVRIEGLMYLAYT